MSRAEITEFAKQYDVTFLFFEKHNVNGATARPVFTNLKTKLLGSFGDFVKWNFTKFLVDRNGLPFAPKDHRKESDPEYTKQNPEYKEIFQNKFSIFDVRFQDHPLSFEQDIKTLLAQKATEE
ncbi:hypothetical protein PF001_g19152 [Phytophthora fragariae]|uniref:Glutathione peroxidase n=1 Tax=Phytophthora fragariae TaxID=53985 RepID=A0A6A4CND3_9STRA|nr:hypothetical protein PF003_g10731 [Phytophthora fragariae]KAE9291461.1 hypothetical protein PF001_g19152 [Phytophthora fragariae]